MEERGGEKEKKERKKQGEIHKITNSKAIDTA